MDSTSIVWIKLSERWQLARNFLSLIEIMLSEVSGGGIVSAMFNLIGY